MAVSKKYSLNKADIEKVARNALIFAAPALLVLFADIVKALPEWVSGPWLIVALWLVNTAADAVRKFISGK